MSCVQLCVRHFDWVSSQYSLYFILCNTFPSFPKHQNAQREPLSARPGVCRGQCTCQLLALIKVNNLSRYFIHSKKRFMLVDEMGTDHQTVDTHRSLWSDIANNSHRLYWKDRCGSCVSDLLNKLNYQRLCILIWWLLNGMLSVSWSVCLITGAHYVLSWQLVQRDNWCNIGLLHIF